jgi:anti-sigma-K factor RskA
MNYESPELLARLADEYVVGTLGARARRRLERLASSSPAVRDAIRAAEDRLAGLSASLPSIEPAAGTWERLAAQVGHVGSSTSSRTRPESQWRFALAAGAAIVALALAWWIAPRVTSPTATASVAAEGVGELWALAIYGDQDRLRGKVTGAIKREPGRSYELWALPEGGNPVSLGLLPEDGTFERELTDAQRAALRLAPKVAVSLEPAGGSPTGAPTGPVLYVANVSRAPS